MRLIVVSFVFLGLAYYQLSGGSGFVPEARPNQLAGATVPAAAPAAEVTRSLPDAGTIDLASLSPGSLNLPAIAPAVPAAEPAAFSPAPFTAEAPEAAAPAVAEAIEAPEVDEPSAEMPAIAVLDLREVAGSRVNMRSGPGTGFDVLATLDGGTAIEVMEIDAEGWARIRVATSGVEGWMAEHLLTPAG